MNPRKLQELSKYIDLSQAVDCPNDCTDGFIEEGRVYSTGPGRGDCVQDVEIELCPTCDGHGEVVFGEEIARMTVADAIEAAVNLGIVSRSDGDRIYLEMTGRAA